jgi:hypothetical protein
MFLMRFESYDSFQKLQKDTAAQESNSVQSRFHFPCKRCTVRVLMWEGNKHRNKTTKRGKMRDFHCTLLFVTCGCSKIFSCSFSRKSQEINNKV